MTDGTDGNVELPLSRRTKMKKINKVLKQLSDLYEFNRRIKGYEPMEKEAAKKRLEKEPTDRRAPQP
jgi:hypothetical protein